MSVLTYMRHICRLFSWRKILVTIYVPSIRHHFSDIYDPFNRCKRPVLYWWRKTKWGCPIQITHFNKFHVWGFPKPWQVQTRYIIYLRYAACWLGPNKAYYCSSLCNLLLGLTAKWSPPHPLFSLLLLLKRGGLYPSYLWCSWTLGSKKTSKLSDQMTKILLRKRWLGWNENWIHGTTLVSSMLFSLTVPFFLQLSIFLSY